MVDSLNAFGEIIESFGGIIINHSYWDCECDHDFIHSASKKKCEKCLAEAINQPNSREEEIDFFGKRPIKHI